MKELEQVYGDIHPKPHRFYDQSSLSIRSCFPLPTVFQRSTTARKAMKGRRLKGSTWRLLMITRQQSG
ncbi:MAG: hypothetical protein ACI33P_01175 [Lysinibacillus sp.]